MLINLFYGWHPWCAQYCKALSLKFQSKSVLNWGFISSGPMLARAQKDDTNRTSTSKNLQLKNKSGGVKLPNLTMFLSSRWGLFLAGVLPGRVSHSVAGWGWMSFWSSHRRHWHDYYYRHHHHHRHHHLLLLIIIIHLHLSLYLHHHPRKSCKLDYSRYLRVYLRSFGVCRQGTMFLR